MRSGLFCKCRVQEPGPKPAPPEGHTRTTWRPRVPGRLSRASTPPRDSARPRWRRTSVDLGSGLCVNGSNTCSVAFRSAPLSQRVCEDPGVRGASRRHSPGAWDEGRDVGEAGSREAVRVHVWPVVCSDPPAPRGLAPSRPPVPAPPKPRRPPSPASASCFLLLLSVPATGKGAPGPRLWHLGALPVGGVHGCHCVVVVLLWLAGQCSTGRSRSLRVRARELEAGNGAADFSAATWRWTLGSRCPSARAGLPVCLRNRLPALLAELQPSTGF